MTLRIGRKAVAASGAALVLVLMNAAPAAADGTFMGQITELDAQIGGFDFTIPADPNEPPPPCDTPDAQLTVTTDDVDPDVSADISDVDVDSVSAFQLPGSGSSDPWFLITLQDSPWIGTNSGTIDIPDVDANIGLQGDIYVADTSGTDCAPSGSSLCTFFAEINLAGSYVGPLDPTGSPDSVVTVSGGGPDLLVGQCDSAIESQIGGQPIVISHMEVVFDGT